MSQYAHKPDSKTIHSKSQLEHFGSIVHDSAITAGGHQMVVTHEGYAIPLHIRNGLYYMHMSPATDTELEQLPHVFLTADPRWNPDIVDEEFFFDVSDTLLDAPIVHDCRDARDTHLDLFASQHTHSGHHGDIMIICNHLGAAVDGLAIFSQTMKRCLPDLDVLLPHFGWVGKERIRDTLAKTSQHYQADNRVPMRKHFRSHFPAANVRCLNEWYSTETFIADEPAFDDGIPGHGACQMMQIYGVKYIIDKALYGLRSSGLCFHERLSTVLRQFGFHRSKVDPDVWMRDLNDMWKFIVVYVDNIIAAMNDPQSFFDELQGPMDFLISLKLFLICLIVASLLLSQVVEVRKAGQPSFPIHFLNKTAIDAFSKWQNQVESATYGSEFTAARQAVEQIIDLRYTLYMFGVPIDGTSWLFGDNKSFVTSSTIPHSTLI